MKKQLILILGGARSGKSSFAQLLAERAACQVAFVATAQAGDEEMQRRIEAHRRARPNHWRTVENPVQASEAIVSVSKSCDLILLDCLTFLVANLLLAEDPTSSPSERVEKEIEALLSAYRAGSASLLVISNEVGMSVVPAYESGRQYRDLLGWANQRLAKAADLVYWMAAGLPIEIKASGLAGNKENFSENN